MSNKITRQPKQNDEIESDCSHRVISGNCREILTDLTDEFDLTFLDPPFNQQKDYFEYSDDLPISQYWENMRDVCALVFEKTVDGGAIYFMQREKNSEGVLRILRETGWALQNLIIWKKMTSAVPSKIRFGKAFQVIAFATKGKRPRVFNRLRIDPPLTKNQKRERENGIFVTDVWDDIRELTSGYFAGDEAIRKENGERFHKQQSPIALLLRIILSSTKIGDKILDPFAGSGTTAMAASQIGRNSINVEADADNVKCIENRLAEKRAADSVLKHLIKYECTENIKDICGIDLKFSAQENHKTATLFAV